MEFNFEIAQEYEMKSHIQWVDENYKELRATIDMIEKGNKIYPLYLDLFFKNDIEVFDKFIEEVKDKGTYLEVAGGICGALPFWKNWLHNTVTIDPLIDRCDSYLYGKYGKSWFSGINKFNCKAENPLIGLTNLVDGFIIWRNGLDHSNNPNEDLRVISSYAAKGCKLLFWSDIKHIEEVDEGHNAEVAKDRDNMESKLVNLGWKIQYRTPSIRDNSKVLDYGCVATKI